MAVLKLEIDSLDWWHCGGGRGAGSHLDAVVDLEDGLPYLPGRQLKGLLREACRCLEEWGHLEKPATTFQLFGRPGGPNEDRHASLPGILQVDSARLPADLRKAILFDAGLKSALFGELFATALDSSGSARPKSLRGIQVSVPLRLETTVSGPDDHFWQVTLRRCFPLVRALGAHRSRGLGRCILRETDHA